MRATRRTFLQAAAATAIATGLPVPGLADARSSTWMGCRKTGGRYHASLFDETGALLIDVPLPGRGHGIVVAPGGKQAIVMARRPGSFGLAVDLDSGTVTHEFSAAPDRHFYGHGCFSADGRMLYTTENDVTTGLGMIGVRDVTDGFAIGASYPTGGIGPHELGLMADGRILAIANGGILTRPDLERAKLNLDSMSPSLVLMDSTSGALRAQYRLPPEHHQLSIRHMSVAAAGIALALQYEGPKTDRRPLLALFDGSTLTLAETPPVLAREMRNYAGSITHDPSGRIIAMTCPRGNLVSFWDAVSGASLGTQSARDICGIAPGNRPGEFIATGGPAALRSSLGRLDASASFADTQWDNHLVCIA